MRDAASEQGINLDKISRLSSSDIHSIRAAFGVQQPSKHTLTVQSFARLRSRIKVCCWLEYCRKQDPLYSYDNDGPALDVSIVKARAVSEEILILTMISIFNFDTFAWYYRGQITSLVLNTLGHDSESIWNWLHIDGLGPEEKTELMILLLERGCDIGQELHSGPSPSLVTS